MTTTEATEGFAAQLRRGTRADHTAAEASGFVTELLEGRLPRAAYAALLAQTHLVYEVLEELVSAHAEHPEVRPFADPALVRLPSLQADLAHLLGPGWRDALVPLPATERYLARLREVGDRPSALVAHHYVRYLGDLSGGQVIRRLVGRAYDLETDGVRFYVFDGVPRPKPYKDRYRAALDAVPWGARERAAAVAEASRAFALNAGVFADLGAEHVPAPPTSAASPAAPA